MPATLIWGKSFHIDEHGEVHGVDGHSDFLSWTSVGAMQDLALAHGVAADLWPIYPDCEVESEAPIADAEMRSPMLRDALERIPAEIVDQDYWLAYVLRLLREGHAFFIMV